MEPDDDLRQVLMTALELASGEGIPDRTHPGFIALEHLVCGMAMSRAAVRILGEDLAPLAREEALNLLTSWISSDAVAPAGLWNVRPTKNASSTPSLRSNN
jgi:hypothetical protein